MDEDVIQALKDHIKTQNIVIERLGNDYYNKDFIFAKMERQYGYPIVIKTVQNIMARLLRIAELNTELTPHSLRHTHTSLLAESGVYSNKSWIDSDIPMIKSRKMSIYMLPKK